MIKELESKINHLHELDLKGDLNDSDYEELKKLKWQLEKEKQKLLPKQVIVVRKDLVMPKGKMGAQIAHASLGPITQLFHINETDDEIELTIKINKHNKTEMAIYNWITNRFTKVVLYVKNEKQLLDVYNKAKDKNLPCSLIEDAGFTVFNEPTKTCLGIGPCYQEDLIGITDKLQLFKD